MSRYEALPNTTFPHKKPMVFQSVESVSDNDVTVKSIFSWRSSSAVKLLLVASSIVPLLASTALLLMSVKNRSTTGFLLSFVIKNRATTQIVVSIISAFLAALNIYTATKLLNLATRIHLLRRSLSLTLIEFIRAVSTRTLVARLPGILSTTTIIIVLVLALPNVMWTGALTPILTTTGIVEPNALRIPAYSENTNETWSRNACLGGDNYNVITNTKGVFSNCPMSVIQSGLLRRASQATSNLSLIHPKDDNSHFSYVGRSYGVGASVGIVDENLFIPNEDSKLLSYNFTEPGYLTDVDCIYNTSMDFHLQEIQEGKIGNGIPFVYYAIGVFPNARLNQGVDFFSVMGIAGDQNIAVIAAKRYENRNVILMTSGSNYATLNSTQCEVRMTPTLFDVTVNVAAKLITVLPQKQAFPVPNDSNSTPQLPIFDPTSGLATTAMDQLNGLGMISTTLHTSVIGDALMSNIRSSMNNSASPSHSANLSSISDSFAAMIDSTLLFIGTSQFFLPTADKNSQDIQDAVGGGDGDFSLVTSSLTVQAVRVGEPRYIIASFAISVALVAVLVIEVFRTRAWTALPHWDFMDTKCLVQASAVAGQDVLDEMCEGQEQEQDAGLGPGSAGTMMQWTGSEEESTNTKEIRIKLGWRRAWAKAAGRSGRRGASEDVQITAVSLWTKNAEGVGPLVR